MEQSSSFQVSIVLNAEPMFFFHKIYKKYQMNVLHVIIYFMQHYFDTSQHNLTHWGRLTHICISKLSILGSDNGLSPGRRQAIIWTNAGIWLIGPLGTNFSEILIAI